MDGDGWMIPGSFEGSEIFFAVSLVVELKKLLRIEYAGTLGTLEASVVPLHPFERDKLRFDDLLADSAQILVAFGAQHPLPVLCIMICFRFGNKQFALDAFEAIIVVSIIPILEAFSINGFFAPFADLGI